MNLLIFLIPGFFVFGCMYAYLFTRARRLPSSSLKRAEENIFLLPARSHFLAISAFFLVLILFLGLPYFFLFQRRENIESIYIFFKAIFFLFITVLVTAFIFKHENTHENS